MMQIRDTIKQAKDMGMKRIEYLFNPLLWWRFIPEVEG